MIPFNDRRAAKNSKISASEFIPMFEGRPLRERAIGHDDFIDLKILLNSTHSVDEFLHKAD